MDYTCPTLDQIKSGLALDQTRFAIAILTACLIKALNEQNPGIQAAFEKHLQEVYHAIHDVEVTHETLRWTNQFLSGRAP